LPQYISEKVNAVIENPGEGDTVELVLGVDSTRIPAIEDWVQEHEGSVSRELPFDMLLVMLPETHISDLSEVEGINSIEFNETLEVLERGNWHSRRV
jgi:hypothetical protein